MAGDLLEQLLELYAEKEAIKLRTEVVSTQELREYYGIGEEAKPEEIGCVGYDQL